MPARPPATTLDQFLKREASVHPGSRRWTPVLTGLARAGKRIAREVAGTGLAGTVSRAGARNVHGEAATRLDHFAHDAVVEEVSTGEMLCCIISEEAENLLPIPSEYPGEDCILAVDPLDGSSNLGVNVPVGTIFSLLPRETPDREPGSGADVSSADRSPADAPPTDASPAPAASPQDEIAPGLTRSSILQPGRRQIAGGYILYGAATVLVYTSGRGVHGFTLDPSSGEFLLTRREIRIPSPSALHYSVNEAYTRRWHPRQRDLVRHFKKPPPRGEKGFSARYIGSLAADIHRTLLVGGLFMYPAFRNKPEGKLRLMYEAAPVAFLAQQAGGRATNGTEDILHIRPRDIHQRTPLFAGARELVELAASFLGDGDPAPGG